MSGGGVMRGFWWSGLVLVGCGALFWRISGMSPGAWLVGASLPERAWSALALAWLLLPLQVAVHELGHAAGGRLLGFRLVRLQVLGLELRRDGDVLRLGTARRDRPRLLGFTQVFPAFEGSPWGRLALFVAAGPAVSLLSAALLHLAGAALEAGGSAVAARVATVATWEALLVGALNLAPFSAGSSRSDGGHLLDLARNARRCSRLALEVLAGIYRDQRPRAWGLEARALLDGAASASAWDRDLLLLSAFAVAVDRDELELADQVLGGLPAFEGARSTQWRWELELQAAMLRSFQGRAEVGRGHLSAAREPLEGPRPYTSLAEAAVLAAEGDHQEARRALAAWEAAVPADPELERHRRIGNDWAVERLTRQLHGPEARST